MSANGKRYNVGGVMLDRPFKIRRLGHFGFHLDRLREAREFCGEWFAFKRIPIQCGAKSRLPAA